MRQIPQIPNLWDDLAVTILYILAGIVVLVFVALGILGMMKGGAAYEDAKSKIAYQYKAKAFFLTRAEHEFYDVLGQAVGKEYRIFAQVHLSSLLDEKIPDQDWRAARAHINRKSVDFLLCDKEFISPKLAIELDDKSHERPDRVERDEEVERILKQAGVPLLRIENKYNFDSTDIANRVHEVLNQK